MHGRSFKEIWKQNLNEDELVKRLEVHSQKLSKNNRGEKNPMFGKPPPKNAGRGISGIWKGLHFRSLLELAFIIHFESKNGRLPETAENLRFAVTIGASRYFPDFFDSVTGQIFEIKPSKLLALNEHKITAGKKAYGKNFIVVTEQDVPYKDVSKNYRTLPGILLHRRK